MTNFRGCPVILISHLAEHTHNVEANEKVSFLVAESGADLQSFGRVTLLGHARAVENDEVEQRYLRYFPDGARYLEIGGFRFFRIEPEQARFIEGFGGIHWVPGEHYLAPPVPLNDAENDILAHMNEDHVDTMKLYCQRLHGGDPKSAVMVGIDLDGFDIRADDALLRFDFAEPVTTPAGARNALAALADQCRALGPI